MADDLFWKYKIVQFFHDPPGKPYQFFPGAGGHWKLARDLFQAFTGKPFERYPPRPDRAASGADRPVLSLPRGTAGGLGNVAWHSNPVVTHPLTVFSLLARHADGSVPQNLAEILEEQNWQTEISESLKELSAVNWADAESLRRGHLVLWRRFREELIARTGNYTTGDLLWERMPADSRCPDHSIWEHLRVATALAYLDTPLREKDRVPNHKTPWLFTLSLGPVQEFIAESRTTRDLWISSFLLSDLAWHAMLPIVKRYGPDCIMYPDLRGNPRVDVWLAGEQRDALPPYLDGNPSTFAATLPHTFTAVLPRGGEGDLPRLEDVARECSEGVQQRWHALAGVVRDWVARKTGLSDRDLRTTANSSDSTSWNQIWDRQIKNVFHVVWNAVPWEIPEHQDEFDFGGALPCQDRSLLKTPSPEDAAAIRARAERLAAWVPPEVWSHYELARNVFAATNPNYLQTERGFDYALAHHQLRERHRIRKQARFARRVGDEGREKCSLAPALEALWDPRIPLKQGRSPGGPSERHREQVREFWRRLDDDRRGEERLSAVCTVKRFLVTADNRAKDFNYIWAGPRTGLDELQDEDGEVRVPFPSAAAIAAQEYLERILTAADLAPLVDAVTAAHRRANLPRTGFARALPRLAAAARTSAGAERFLKLDVQRAVFPHVLDAEIAYRHAMGDEEGEHQLSEILEPVKALHRAACGSGRPQTRMAVVMLDADEMGRLLLGDAEVISAPWRDVIHPGVVKKMRERKPFVEAGWNELLESHRLVGPALHAFITRALADFAHVVVPWVVEREFGGRLIYAGGDDVLALAPASDALPMAARLQQLFSAAWFVDTQRTADPWAWRRRGWDGTFDQGAARRRFAVPRWAGSPVDLRDPATEFEPHVTEDRGAIGQGPRDGRVLGMLGPSASLSAGIVYAHFKTPMSVLLQHARQLLNQVAKEQFGRRAVALSHFSRNGPKSTIGMKWGTTGDPLAAARRIEAVTRAFREQGLSGRVPYKLREVAHLAHAARTDAAAKVPDTDVLQGLLRRALDAKVDQDVYKALLALWQDGFRTHRDDSERAVEGLLLCRALRDHTQEDDE